MPLHQCREGRLVTAADVVGQELAIGPSSADSQKRPLANVLHDLAGLAGRHVSSFVGATVALYRITTRSGPFDTLSLYGMPAYDFLDDAHLDDGAMWPTAFALKELTAAKE